MDSTARELIVEYAQSKFTKELYDELMASFMVLDAFVYQGLDDDLIDILNGIEEDSDVIQDEFLECVNRHLTKVLRSHQVYLSDDAELSQKNQILAVLFRLQRLEDPVPPLRILETLDTNEAKFAKLVNAYSEMDESQATVVIESVDDSLLKNLMTHLYAAEEESENDLQTNSHYLELKTLKANLKDFCTVNGAENLAAEMMENGIEAGLSVRLYYPFVKEHLVTEDDTQTAKNIISLFLMAIDTYKDPVVVYRKYSEQLIPSVDRIVKIEVKIGELLNQLYQYQEAQNAARSLSVVQHPA